MSSSIPRIEQIVLDKGDTGLGFNIRGGLDNIHIQNDPGIFVTTVRMNGAAAKDGRLQKGDKILEINGVDLREVQHQKAVSCFHNAGKVVTLLVERGAEQRILGQADVWADQGGTDDSAINKSQVVQRNKPGFWRWGWIPPVALLVGGSTAFLIYLYIRRRRR